MRGTFLEAPHNQDKSLLGFLYAGELPCYQYTKYSCTQALNTWGVGARNTVQVFWEVHGYGYLDLGRVICITIMSLVTFKRGGIRRWGKSFMGWDGNFAVAQAGF